MSALKTSEQRGYANHGWLKSYHSFSFANYYDPKNMGFRSLRVINEDYIAGGMGFGKHPHRDMEIITYVVKGALQHKDSMGNESVINPGDVQYMSAGTGVFHSEFNARKLDETHLFQIWIMPNEDGGEPRYDQKTFESKFATQTRVLAASMDGRDGSIKIKQDADFWIGRLGQGKSDSFEVRKGRGIYLHVTHGQVSVNGNVLNSGDSIELEAPGEVRLVADQKSGFLLFDLV